MEIVVDTPEVRKSVREDRLAVLGPLLDRLPRPGFHWRKGKDGPRLLKEPLNAVHLSEHVAGGAARGLCPVAPGESTTRVALLDLDSHGGETPFGEMVFTGRRLARAMQSAGLLPHIFRSSGGKGLHLIVVFDEPQDAYSVRELLKGVLISCGFKDGSGGVAAKESELFPRQDEVPPDGFGNCFILPYGGLSEPIGEFEDWTPSRAVPVLQRSPRPEPQALAGTPPELERLRSALKEIPNDAHSSLEYDLWRNCVFAIHHASGGSDDGLALAIEFSSRSPKFNEEFLIDRVWPYARSERGGSVITEGTIYKLARELGGWEDSNSDVIDDFNVLEDEQPAGRRRFQFQSVGEFERRRPSSWVIKSVLRGAVAMVFGASGSGKSFFVLDMVAAVARGVDWCGKKTKRGRVAYIVAEGGGGFGARVQAYRKHHGVEAAALDLFLLDAAPNLLAKPDINETITELCSLGPLALVVCDTFSAMTPGGDENSGKDFGLALDHCKAIHRATGALVLIVHHSGKDSSKGARGWSGGKAGVDAEIEVVRADQDRVAKVSKLKDGEDGEEFGFRLLSVPVDLDEDGDIVSSCVVEHRADVCRQAFKRPPKGANEKLVWQAVLDLQGLDGRAPDANAVIEAAIAQIPKPAEGRKDNRRGNMLRALQGLEKANRVVSVGGRVLIAGTDNS